MNKTFYLILNLDGEVEFASLDEEKRDEVYENDYSQREDYDYYLCSEFTPSDWVVMA